MFGFSSRPVPFFSSVLDAEEQLSMMDLQLHGVKTQFRTSDLCVSSSSGVSVDLPAGHPDAVRICDALENMLLFNVRHCRDYINRRTAL